MRWPWRAAPPAPPLEFDALVDLHYAGPPAPFQSAVKAAIAALPGAGWIDVAAHARPTPTSIRLFPAGHGQEGVGPGWTRLHAQVAAAVDAAIAVNAAPPRPEAPWPAAPSPTAPSPAATGFAEALSPSQLAAFEQLATLAQATPARPPPVQPLPGPSDVDRLARLLAFVLPSGAHIPAQAAIRQLGSFPAVLAAPEAELRRIPGLGTHSVAAIKLVHAAALRLAQAGLTTQPVLDDPDRLHAYLAAALARERVEQFRILFLDAQGMLRADEVQATGTVNHTPVYPREVVRRALALNAAAIVLVHNHPSGDPEPSPEDLAMTRQVAAAASALGLVVRDHVIVGNGRWLSFRQAGLLP